MNQNSKCNKFRVEQRNIKLEFLTINAIQRRKTNSGVDDNDINNSNNSYILSVTVTHEMCSVLHAYYLSKACV